MALFRSPPLIRLFACSISSSCKETKRSAIGDIPVEIIYIIKVGMLTAQYRRIVIHHYCYPKVIQGQGRNFNVSVLFAVNYGFRNFKKVSQSAFCSSVPTFLQRISKHLGTSIHNRRFRSVQLNEYIVDLKSYQVLRAYAQQY